jgi:hypothetical protein
MEKNKSLDSHCYGNPHTTEGSVTQGNSAMADSEKSPFNCSL